MPILLTFRTSTGRDEFDEWYGWIILKVEGHHIRLVGYWGPIQGQFIIVLRHDKNEQGALASKHSKVARDRRAEVQINPARAKVWFDA